MAAYEHPREVRVEYPGFSEGFDEVLTEFFESQGYHRWASGFNHEADTRDLAFELEQEE